jgi:hypothetical protein
VTWILDFCSRCETDFDKSLEWKNNSDQCAPILLNYYTVTLYSCISIVVKRKLLRSDSLQGQGGCSIMSSPQDMRSSRVSPCDRILRRLVRIRREHYLEINTILLTYRLVQVLNAVGMSKHSLLITTEAIRPSPQCSRLWPLFCPSSLVWSTAEFH